MKNIVTTITHLTLNFFPPAILISSFAMFCYGIAKLSFLYCLISFAIVYLLPVTIYRIFEFFYPTKEGASYFKKGKYHSWAIGFRIQIMYDQIQLFEQILRVLPFAYSSWLRLWGSKIGNNVFFSPGMIVMDRSMLEIGDNVVFGARAVLSPHMVRHKNNKQMLYIKKIKIGSNTFIGGDSYLGPGSFVSENKMITGKAMMTINFKNSYCLPMVDRHKAVSAFEQEGSERSQYIKRIQGRV